MPLASAWTFALGAEAAVQTGRNFGGWGSGRDATPCPAASKGKRGIAAAGGSKLDAGKMIAGAIEQKAIGHRGAGAAAPPQPGCWPAAEAIATVDARGVAMAIRAATCPPRPRPKARTSKNKRERIRPTAAMFANPIITLRSYLHRLGRAAVARYRAQTTATRGPIDPVIPSDARVRAGLTTESARRT